MLVIDAGAPRNAPAGHVHNYLGREGASPGDLLAAGRAEVASYGGRVVTGTVVSAERLDSERLDSERLESTSGGSTDGGPADGARFRAVLADGRLVRARRLLVTTGLVDELPDVPGVGERWGRDVLHCPYCHGWEVRDQAIGILATGPMAVHQTLMFRQLSPDVTLFLHTGPAPSEEEREQLDARGIACIEGEVAALEVTDDQLTGVRLRSGQLFPRQAVVVAPRFSARAEMLTSLGLETTEMLMGDYVMGSYIAADPMGATAVPGVWVAGNVADLRAQVISSAAAGLNSGAAINADLIAEDTADAVAAHRARRVQEVGAGQ